MYSFGDSMIGLSERVKAVNGLLPIDQFDIVPLFHSSGIITL